MGGVLAPLFPPALLAAALLWGPTHIAAEDADVAAAFSRYMTDFGKTYADRREELARFVAFQANHNYILAANARGGSYQLGLNPFADMTPAEFEMMRTGASSSDAGSCSGSAAEAASLGEHFRSNATLPPRFDWTERQVATLVQDQGSYSSGWAFSAVGAVEAAWQLATGQMKPLSAQQVLDCSSSQDSSGCGPGSVSAALSYLASSPCCTQLSYPYEAKPGICEASSCAIGVPLRGVAGARRVPVDKADLLMDAIVQQPVAVAVRASGRDFQLYKDGVLTCDCDSKASQGMLLVGFGEEDGQPYWLVRNSWGPSWGRDGFAKLARGAGGGAATGIAAGVGLPGAQGGGAAAECCIGAWAGYPVVRGELAAEATSEESLASEQHMGRGTLAVAVVGLTLASVALALQLAAVVAFAVWYCVRRRMRNRAAQALLLDAENTSTGEDPGSLQSLDRDIDGDDICKKCARNCRRCCRRCCGGRRGRKELEEEDDDDDDPDEEEDARSEAPSALGVPPSAIPISATTSPGKSEMYLASPTPGARALAAPPAPSPAAQVRPPLPAQPPAQRPPPPPSAASTPPGGGRPTGAATRAGGADEAGSASSLLYTARRSDEGV